MRKRVQKVFARMAAKVEARNTKVPAQQIELDIADALKQVRAEKCGKPKKRK